MAMQIVPGGNESTYLGSALSDALQGLAGAKLQSIAGRNQQLQNQLGLLGVGFTPEESLKLQFLEPKALQEVTKQKLQEPSREAFLQLFNQMLGGGAGDITQAMNPNLPSTGVKPLIKPGINPQQAIQLAQMQNQQQQQLRQFAQPILDKIEDRARPARELIHTAEQALKYVDKAITGPQGKFTPAYFQSQEGQNLQQLISRLVITSASTGKGLPTVGRLRLEENAKAAIWNHPKVMKAILQRIIDNPEYVRDVAEGNAVRGLLESGEIPKNFQQKIVQTAAKDIQEQKKTRAAAFTKSSLPSAANLPDGAKARNPVTDEVEYEVRNGKWEKSNG